MKNLTKNTILKLFTLALAIVLCMSVFCLIDSNIYADATTHTITFKLSGENNEEAKVIKTITLNNGDNLILSDLPKAGDEGLPKIDNISYIWFYVVDGRLTKATIPSTESGVVIENVAEDITFWAIKQDNSEKHTVTFIMPDSTVVTKTVGDGLDVDEPIFDLGFCQRLKFDKSLENIKEDTIITVTIDNTLKYVFMVICGVLIFASLVVVVYIAFKMLKTPEDDEPEDGLVKVEEVNLDNKKQEEFKSYNENE